MADIEVDFNQPEWVIAWENEVWIQFPVKSDYLNSMGIPHDQSYVIKVRTDFREAVITDFMTVGMVEIGFNRD